MACLCSRIPYGGGGHAGKSCWLIENAENVLRDLGFFDVRVRHHELRSQIGGSDAIQHLARIEVGPAEMKRFLEDGLAERVAADLKRIGYQHVTLDLLGYRRGSTNEVFKPEDIVSTKN